MFTNSRFFQCFHLLATVFALVARGVDTPDSSSFRRRVFISATVLGDYVYFDGGEISEIVDNIQPDPSHASYWDISISLKLDWTNDTVSLKATAKTNAPVFNFPGLWPDIGSSNFYMWSGSMAYAGQGRVPPANQLWKFTADGNGGGVWASVKSGNSVAFSQLVRPDNCAFCVINNVGYCVGGSVDSGSDPSIPSDVSYALPGVVGYDISSQTWENSSSVGFGGFGTLLAGRSAYVPFGPKGLMLLLGGSQSPVGNTSLAEPNDFVNLTLWDPTTKRWYSQETTGSRPIPKSNFCVVGAQGLNGTFIYGGVTYDDTTSDQVYVLSLPGFVFFLAPATATKRAQHACILAGKRQMLSIGGDPATMPYLESLLTPDPWIQGLGVLDLPTISWTSSYNSNAGEYDSPEVVKGWYSDGGLATASWSSDTVKQLFKNMSGECLSAWPLMEAFPVLDGRS
ncbi:hypothetical protein GQ53DRAFT_820413 [Thozetella sp. PMI_491]|nr:hypothetical protein GQ53DRAFT_820413 [Thozetella sp. PMI_491]